MEFLVVIWMSGKGVGRAWVGSRVSLVYLENFLGIFLSKESGLSTFRVRYSGVPNIFSA